MGLSSDTRGNAGDDRTEAAGDDTVRLGSEGNESELPDKYAVSVVIKKGRKKGAEYSITSGRTVLGRGSGADIILDDPAISRMHAAIEFRKSKFVLKDLESTNGTLIDGKSIKETALSHGDLFQIGDTVIEFSLAEKRGESVYVID